MKRSLPRIIGSLVALASVTLGTMSSATAGQASPSATDVGITAKEIRVAVIADVDNQAVPGLFAGDVAGVKAAAKQINRTGGIAGRDVVVDFYDSHLSATDSRNAVIEACANDFAIVGSATIFLNTVEDLVSCPDKSGAPVGIPELAAVATDQLHICAPVTYYITAGNSQCSTLDEPRPTYTVSVTTPLWLKKNRGATKGVWVLSADTESTKQAEFTTVAGENSIGIKREGVFPLVSSSPQSAFTPVVRQIKESGANYVWNGMQFNGLISLRKEAQIQGVTVDNWVCPTQCYNEDFLEQGGAAVEDTYVAMNFLPFDETGANKALKTAVKGIEAEGGPLDGFSITGYSNMMAFAEVANSVAADDPDALTRESFLEGLADAGEFDAGGILAPVNIGSRAPTNCSVITQVQDGEFVRVYPKKAGAFGCNNKRAVVQVDTTTGEWNRVKNG